MALGPQQGDELTVEEQKQCDSIEEAIDSALATRKGEQRVALEVRTDKLLSGAQIEYLRERYIEAGWGSCEIRHSRPVFGSIPYAVDLGR